MNFVSETRQKREELAERYLVESCCSIHAEQALDDYHDWLMQRTGWQPIETVPTNGTAILFFGGGSATGICTQSENTKFVQLHSCAKEEITHWMPLPAPPKETL